MPPTPNLSLENDGVNLCAADGQLYIRHGRCVSRYTFPALREAASRQVLAKKGRARALAAFGGRLFLRDFCDLYVLDADSLDVTRTWKLGRDASSDLCALCGEGDTLYVCMRGGGLRTLHLASQRIDEHTLGAASAWDMAVHGDLLYACTVEGELIALTRRDMRIVQRRRIHKKNIYSMRIDGGLIYTTSQDGALQAVDARTLETVCLAKGVLTNMTTLVGMYDNCVITANPNRNELSFWRKENLANQRVVSFPTGGLSHRGVLQVGQTIVGSDRNGLYALDLSLPTIVST